MSAEDMTTPAPAAGRRDFAQPIMAGVLAAIVGYAIMRSRRRAKQGPLAPGEPDPTSGRAAPTQRP